MENHLIIGLGGTGGKIIRALRKDNLSGVSQTQNLRLSISASSMSIPVRR